MKAKFWLVVLIAAALTIAMVTCAGAAGSVNMVTKGNGDIVAPSSTARVNLIKVCYYDLGGTAHTITPSATPPGPLYSAANADVILSVTASYSGPGGKGFVEIYDMADLSKNYVSKLIPSGKTVTATTPAAIAIFTPKRFYVFASGPDGVPWKGGFFQIDY